MGHRAAVVQATAATNSIGGVEMSENAVLAFDHITKTYPGVVALKDVSLNIPKGTIHAICGENGAGKSTLIKTLSGAIAPDSDGGTITVFGHKYTALTPQRARDIGIEVIYQEFNLAPHLSIMENMFLGSFPGKFSLVNYKEMEKRTREVFQMMEVDLNPRAPVKSLSVGMMQIVEIAKAISRDAKILVMDEPTAPLTEKEIEILFKLVRKLREKEITIIYISHRLNEIFDICDNVTVMRDGSIIGTHKVCEYSREDLVKEMVGRTFSEVFPDRVHAYGEELMRVENLCGGMVQDISFTLHRGEILALAGLVGAGRTEMLRMLFGADGVASGEIYVKGKKTDFSHPTDAVKLGIGMVPEDRMNHGVALSLPIRNNIVLATLKKISRFSLINMKQEKEMLEEQKNRLRIKTDSLKRNVGSLSGGNQQKVVLAKWLAAGSEILLLDEPTRGIDVGSKSEIYRLMDDLTKQGYGIIMVSSEMEEVLGMSDRLVVMSEGKYMGTIEAGSTDFTQEKVLDLASGNR